MKLQVLHLLNIFGATIIIIILLAGFLIQIGSQTFAQTYSKRETFVGESQIPQERSLGSYLEFGKTLADPKDFYTYPMGPENWVSSWKKKSWSESALARNRLVFSGTTADEDGEGAPKSETTAEHKSKPSSEEMGDLVVNPLSYLWIANLQNDTAWWKGDLLDELDEDAKIMNTTVIQPVMAMQMTKKWKAILRPIIPIQSFETLRRVNVILDEESEAQISGDFERKTGLGDVILWTAFSNAYTPPFVYGFGPTLMFPTATNKNLGTEKWSAGPMGLGLYIGKQWILGGVGQHWWSYGGESDRQSVNLTDFQYIIRYRLNSRTNIGMAPNIQVNWDADSGEKLRLPVGIGGDRLIYLGPLPVKIGLEYQYYIKKPDLVGPQHLIRFIFSPVLPAPAWSRTPLFGD